MTEIGHIQSDLTLPSSTCDLSYVLFGLECGFTTSFLSAIVQAGAPPAAILLPGPPHFEGILKAETQRGGQILTLTATPDNSVSSIASDRELPCYRVGDLSARTTQESIAAISADLIVTVCFNRRIPIGLLDRFHHGGINVHPSLLPELRGPDPLFWTFRRGDERSGVTIHQMTAQFDAGPILAQIELELAEGTTETQLERRLAELAAVRLVTLLDEIKRGDTRLAGQNEVKATYAPHPTSKDFVVSPEFSVRRAYKFVRGVAGRATPVRYRSSDDTEIEIVDALAYNHSNEREEAEEAQGRQWLKFSDGYLLAVVERKTNAM